MKKSNVRKSLSTEIKTSQVKEETTPPSNLPEEMGTIPTLKDLVDDRWLQTQKCEHVGACLAAITAMGNILEKLLQARAYKDLPTVYESSKAPRDEAGNVLDIKYWQLNALLQVAADVGWIELSANNLLKDAEHPWLRLTEQATFDPETCNECWQTLSSSYKELTQMLM